MFKRRDIPPVLLLLLLIILVMLTLSQILVVHNGRYGRNVHNLRKLQLELREMDVNLHALMMQNVPSIELNRRMLQNEINAHRFVEIISQASHIDPDTDQLDLPSSRLNYGANSPQRTLSTSWRTLNGTLAGSGVAKVSSARRGDGNIRRDTDSKAVVTSDQSAGSQDADRWSAPDGSYRPEDVPDTAQLYRTLKPPTKVKYCPSIPPGLEGRFPVDLDNSSLLTWHDVATENPEVRPGGVWAPRACVARHKVAIIIPYRDREQHLITLLYYLHPILQRQQLDYRLYVVEQQGRDTFNKARIMNIAFVEALKQYGFQCFVFHDVDLVPEDDTNMYSCPEQPRHMSVAIDEMGYKLAYQELVGGVLSMKTEHFQRVNGYSNLYWGWGAEDDDMAYRIMHVGLKITRPPDSAARYKMAKHTKRKPADWRKRAKLLYTGTRRFQFDGLNSLQYKVLHNVNKPLYTHMLVDIGRPPRGF